MRFIDIIEEEINLVKMYNLCKNGDARYSHVAKLISLFLINAGAEVSQEEVYLEIFNGTEDPKTALMVVSEIIKSCFFDSDAPQKKTTKK